MKLRLLPTLILLTAVLGLGTTGYVLIEGWSAWDALYMTVTTVATVGFREVHPLSRAGEAFTLLLILVGVSTALYAFSVFAAVVVEGGWPRYVERWRYTRMIDNLSEHYIICGYGRIGSIIAAEFKRQGTPFVIVDRHPERVAEANHKGYLAVEGDASREDVLKTLGVDRARGLVAAVGQTVPDEARLVPELAKHPVLCDVCELLEGASLDLVRCDANVLHAWSPLCVVASTNRGQREPDPKWCVCFGISSLRWDQR